MFLILLGYKGVNIVMQYLSQLPVLSFHLRSASSFSSLESSCLCLLMPEGVGK